MPANLHQRLADLVTSWRQSGYPHEYSALNEILRWAEEPEGEPALTVEGRKAIAVRKWQDLNPDRLKYELIFAREATIPYNDLKPARDFVETPPLAKGDQGGFGSKHGRKTSAISPTRGKLTQKARRS